MKSQNNSSLILLAVGIILAVAHVARSQGTEGPPPLPCPDTNGDGVVDIQDLTRVIIEWGACHCPGDTNGDGVVDIQDLIRVIIEWGVCQP